MDLQAYFNLRLIKESLKMINPVTLTLFLAIIVTGTVTMVYFPPGLTVQPDQQINPIKSANPTTNPTEATGAGIANALIFVVLTLIGGVAFIFFIKYGLDKLMNYILAFTFFIAAIAFSDVLLPALFYPIFVIFNISINYLDPNGAFILSISLALGIINLIGFTIIKNQYLHNTLMIMFGIMMGTFFGIFFDSFSLLFVLVALALYDIYAVFRGPLKTMFDKLDMNSERDELNQSSDPVESATYQNFQTGIEEETLPTTVNQNTVKTYSSAPQQETLEKAPSKVKNPQIRRGITLPVYATPYITIGLGDFAFFSILIAKATFLAIKGNFLLLPAIDSNGVIYWSLIVFPFVGNLIG